MNQTPNQSPTVATPFLLQVARHYLDDGACALHDRCFVFPNRRSGQFFTYYLQRELDQRDRLLRDQGQAVTPHMLPRVVAINDLASQLSGTVAATDIEMIFALYAAYCDVMGDKAQEFDHFIYWAQLIVSDFNDIDRSLADARAIYSNISAQRDVTSNYMTPEVMAKTQALFGDNLFTAFFDTSDDADLWQHRASAMGARDDDGTVKQEFLTLWNALYTIYQRYHERLADQGLCSPGAQLRRVAQSADPLPITDEQLAFVGFGVLSAAELKLFKRLKGEGIAQFCWDNAGLERLADNDPARKLIGGYISVLGNIALEPLAPDARPYVQLVSVPSTVGQAKVAFNIVEHLMAEGRIADQDNAIDTAIVLPDEGLLVPLLHSIKGINRLNITLGYPLHSSSVISLMHLVARMHRQASKVNGAWHYYREDVKDVLSHPIIKTHFTDQALHVKGEIERTNPFKVPAAWFDGTDFGLLFMPAIDSDQDVQTGAGQFIDRLLAFCDLIRQRMNSQAQQPDADADDDESLEQPMPLQTAFITMYIDVLKQLKRLLMGTDLMLKPNTVFYLIDRLAAAAVIPFTGEPLHGLQIMGLLETRNLDFSNIIILSANERIFPRKRSINSFIPNYLRRANGMSTVEQQEAITAFNFYRLLNRARHVTLVYDSSDSSRVGSNEPSRFVDQLEKVYGYHIHRHAVDLDIHTSQSIPISVPNDGTARHKYTTPPQQGGGRLSASAINKYLSCPLAFWFNHIQGLKDDNELTDFMDAGTYGTIVHDVLHDLYMSKGPGGTFTVDDIRRLMGKALDERVRYHIRKTFLKVDDRDNNDNYLIDGEAYMLIEPITTYARNVLAHDCDLANEHGAIQIVNGEADMDIPGMTMGNATFNFFFKIDRIDRVGGQLRIIDYKTGSDDTSFNWAEGQTLDDLFDEPGANSSKKRHKAILQMFLYCYAYLYQNPDEQAVTPMIYKLGKMSESGIKCKVGRESEQVVFTLDSPLAQQFAAQMGSRINALFDDPFTQANEDTKACNYCRFIDFCRRTPKDFNRK